MVMSKRTVFVAALVALGIAGGAGAQGRILEMVANKVIGKYQNATCEQLAQKKNEPKSEEEQRAVEFLRSDPQARTEFLNKVAGPIANKMFECGLIP
jgi:tellurite resistance protein